VPFGAYARHYVRVALSKAVAQADAIRRSNLDEPRLPIHSLDAVRATDIEGAELLQQAVVPNRDILWAQ
jgi:hypothetical protein